MSKLSPPSPTRKTENLPVWETKMMNLIAKGIRMKKLGIEYDF